MAALQNDFTLEFSRREVAGPVTRLWLCGEDGFVEIPTTEIQRIDQKEPAPPKPSTEAAPPKPSRESAEATQTVSELSPGASIQALIAGAASRHGIDPDFVASVVKVESGFNPSAISPKGARGLMQLMPQTAASFGVENAFDPAANIEAGTRYLRQLLELYDGDAVKALAAYNAGPQRVLQYGGLPPYSETRAYVSRVIHDYNRQKPLSKHARPLRLTLSNQLLKNYCRTAGMACWVVGCCDCSWARC